MKMINDLTNVQEQNRQSRVYCPIVGKQVIANSWKYFSVSNKQATWWHCPECLGWHVVVGKGKKTFHLRMN